ncbi:kunitz-type protease inhibitor 2 isoform 1-T1 [Anomaloglossus baeobatrachus]|uniref:kunitz-type protease inhibitor 2 isoform X1 n=1 Tax=Anomaloglossus baeobatrachus TaxID=238106 RepID=UPI003F4FA6CF
MAAWIRALLVLLLPLALADTELPCAGYEVVDGFGLEKMESSVHPTNLLEDADVADEQACWSRCCDTDGCDLAVFSPGRCLLLPCNVAGFSMCVLGKQEGVRSYRKLDSGAQPTLDDFCLAEKDSGPCKASFIKWFYDAKSETCKNFTYGGCPVNLNNYPGEEECRSKCQGVNQVQRVDTAAPSKRMVSTADVPEYCSGPAVTGNCRAAFRRWYFDADSWSCKMFIYGGCGGSTNNHMSEQDCTTKCSLEAPKPDPAQVHSPEKKNFKEYCGTPSYTGPCRAAFQRWFYDASTGTCKQFVFGGCKPKKNNYITESDCQDTCSGRSEDDDDFADHNVMHRSLSAVVLPILLALLAALLIGVMILFFVKVTRRNQETAGFRAMWNPIDDKECLMNSAYTL